VLLPSASLSLLPSAALSLLPSAALSLLPSAALSLLPSAALSLLPSAALSLRCCVIFSLRVLALVSSPLSQVSFFRPGKSSLRVLRSMNQGNYHHRQWTVCWSHCRGVKPGSELESWRRASSLSRFVEVLQVLSPVGGHGFAAAPAPLAFVSVCFCLSSCLICLTVKCVVYSS